MAEHTQHHQPAERTLFIDDAATHIGVSRRTVYYWIRDGRLRTVRTRLGSQRVLLSSIEAMKQGPRKGPAGCSRFLDACTERHEGHRGAQMPSR